MSLIYSTQNRYCSNLLLLLAAIYMLTASCGGKQQGGFAPPPTPVEIATVNQTGVVDRFYAVGTVDAAERITVATEINAIVMELPFEEGQSIEKGGLIARLDDAQALAEVSSASASRDQAKISYDRTREIVQARGAAQQDLDDATARLKIAEARLEQAQVALSKTRIRAPFPGVLGIRRVSPGAYLRTGDAITTLSQINQVKVMLSVPERIVPYLEVGAQVAVSTPVYPDKRLKGKISVIDPIINESTRTVQAIARIDNREMFLRSGMSADVSIVLETRPDAVTVPDEAIFAEGNQDFVFLINADSTVVKTAVTLGSRQPGTVEITHGLTAGQQIVKAGHQKLYDGARVMSIPSGAQQPTKNQDQADVDSTSTQQGNE